MSDYGAYDDGPRRYKTSRVRPRARDEPEYMEETTFIERGKGPPPRELVYRPRDRDRDEDVEEIQRDFPPPDPRRPRGYRDNYEAPVRRARSAVSRRYDDGYDDYAGPAAGAAAGYAAGRARGARNGRDDPRGGRDDPRRDRRQRRDDYSDEESPPRRKERKSGVTEVLEGLGLGGIVGAITGRSKSQERGGRGDRRSGRGDSRDRSRSRGGNKKSEYGQAALAAAASAAITAFQQRGDGPWDQDKIKRVATAALSTGVIDKLLAGGSSGENSKRHLIEAVVGGLAANRLANGPIDKTEGGRGRSQSRSRSVLDRFRSKSRRGRDSDSGSDRGRGGGESHGGIKDLAAGGALAAVAKGIYDQVRSKSRARRSPSSSSADSYVASRQRGGRDRDVGGNFQSRGGSPDQNAVVARGPQRGRGESRAPSLRGGGRGRSSSTDSESSTDIEEKRKKLRGKEFVTAGLASIATIHAAHGVYQSMEASEKRHKLVQGGEMSPEEARKKRGKAWLQDAAAIGIAALGIKGAYSEWKEMNEQRHSVKELEERRRKRQKRREKRMKEAKQHSGGGGGRGGGYGDGYGDSPNGYYQPYNPPPPPMGGVPYR